jgi:hypothetical protein
LEDVKPAERSETPRIWRAYGYWGVTIRTIRKNPSLLKDGLLRIMDAHLGSPADEHEKEMRTHVAVQIAERGPHSQPPDVDQVQRRCWDTIRRCVVKGLSLDVLENLGRDVRVDGERQRDMEVELSAFSGLRFRLWWCRYEGHWYFADGHRHLACLRHQRSAWQKRYRSHV